MQSKIWISLVKRIPVEDHENVLLFTSTGLGLNVQNFVRMEPEYMIIRGRQEGSTDSGRIFFVPYDQISYFGIMRGLKTDEVMSTYGPGAGVSEAEVDADTAAAEAAEAPAAAAPISGARPLGNEPLAKPNLRDRLRGRTTPGGGAPGPQTPGK